MKPSRRPSILLLILAAGLAGLAHAEEPKKPAPPPADSDPVLDKAAGLKEAGAQLEKANSFRQKGNKNLAEQLFSGAELIVGPDALADIAPLFREGAPPRVQTPTKKLEDTGAQPAAVGGSDDDEPDKKPQKSNLTGTMTIEGGGEAIGFVTLEPVGKKWKKRVPKQRIIEQRGREFAPRVLAIPVGSTVAFPNFDGYYHNVFSTSDVAKFDLGLYKNGEAREYQFNQAGIIRLGCNLHANMSAWIVVVTEPHYTLTDTKGAFKFRSLAPGKYTLRAWSEKSTTPVVQEIVLKAGQNTVAVGVKGDAPTGLMPDKFGAARGGKK